MKLSYRFLLTLLAIAAFTAFGPAERTLGENVRVVYLHGAWVWVALIAFVASAGAGLAGLITRRPTWHAWSLSLGRTGLFFWISYLPISMWAMQTNWNGLFLAEPRWRFGLAFAVAGLLLQIAIVLLESPPWASGINLGYGLALLFALGTVEQVMHPASPILSSGAWRIQLFFGGLVLLTLSAAWQMSLWWLKFRISESTTLNR